MSSEEAQEELAVLASIYGVTNGEFEIPVDFGEELEVFQFIIDSTSPDYPSRKEPSFHLKFPSLYRKSTYKQREWERQVLIEVRLQLSALFEPGHVCLFDWIEFLKSFVEDHKDQWLLDAKESAAGNESADEATKEIVSQIPKKTLADYLKECPEIHHSKAPLVEKKSVFIAHVARCSSMRQVKACQKVLMSDPKILKATHNISAYRIVEDNGVISQDSNDDGEDAAGARLLHLLQLADVTNVYCVVSRYYGGIQLGPARFKLINNCARHLLVDVGLILT